MPFRNATNSQGSIGVSLIQKSRRGKNNQKTALRGGLKNILYKPKRSIVHGSTESTHEVGHEAIPPARGWVLVFRVETLTLFIGTEGGSLSG